MPGAQKLSLGLGNGCNLTATVMHELLHALGFWHEQSRADRNLYVEILWENIQGGSYALIALTITVYRDRRVHRTVRSNTLQLNSSLTV